ncbi:MAG: acyl-CoA dehydratase activase [Thermodesulfobacteriota bacterium]|nr:acyl-CoA dehydratase activase [Thermodesulfobacteriota bacterium]
MITMGIDMGAKTIKVVILDNDKITGKSIIVSGLEEKESAEKAIAEALSHAGITRDKVEMLVATGAGRKNAPAVDDDITEVGADAKGANFLYPDVSTLIDVGAEEGKAIRVDEKGLVKDFAVNEKCAAGAGAFIEAMARALEVGIEEFGKLSLESDKAIPMNAQCAVFAESEVVSLIHAKTPKPDIAKAIHDAIADRIVSLVRRVGIEQDVVLIGGMALNEGFIESLQRAMETKVKVPKDCEYIGALGAALAAKERR